MKRPPRPPQEGILDRSSVLFVLFMGTFMGLLILGLYYYYLKYNYALANTMFFAGIITFRLINALNCKSPKESLFKLGFFTNKWLLLALASSFAFMLLVIYSPLQKIFSLKPLEIKNWLILLSLGLTILIVDEIKKKYFSS